MILGTSPFLARAQRIGVTSSMRCNIHIEGRKDMYHTCIILTGPIDSWPSIMIALFGHITGLKNHLW